LVLVGILLVCVLGLVAYVWIRLGRKKKVIQYRGVRLHLNAALPAGKIVFVDATLRPIGEMAFEGIDIAPLPPQCAGMLLSPKDYASILARPAKTEEIAATQRRQA